MNNDKKRPRPLPSSARSGTGGRPHLGLGSVGTPWINPKHNGGYTAGVWMRDIKGRRRQVTASGATKGDARRALEAKIAAVSSAPVTGIQPDWRLETLLEYWLALKKRTGNAHKRAPL